MSLTGFKAIKRELIEFLWRQWSQLGIAGDATFRDGWIIDPEALLLATLVLGRFDPRLFDEVLDWCVVNERWLSVQRVKNLLRRWRKEPSSPAVSERLSRTVAAFSAVMDDHDSRKRWKPLEKRAFPSDDRYPAIFFLDESGSPLPLWGSSDPRFEAAGWLRPPAELRGLSSPALTDSPACLLLKLRALFGLSPRAEAMAYLLARSAAGARTVARATSFSAPAVRESLHNLMQGGFLYARQNNYQANGERWRSFLELPTLPIWIDWPGVFSALTLGIETLIEMESENLSAYLTASRMLTLHDAMQAALFDSGLSHPFDAPCSLEDAPEATPERLLQFSRMLNANEAEFPEDRERRQEREPSRKN